MCLIEIIKFRILCVDITNDFINHFFFYYKLFKYSKFVVFKSI